MTYHIAMSRFPDVDWFCDRCSAHLNFQSGFDDNKYTWKCEECGHKNSISRDNIFDSPGDYHGGGDPIKY